MSFKKAVLQVETVINIYSTIPGGSDSKVSAYNAGDLGSIPPLGRLPGEGNGNPLQYSCLENPLDRRTWEAIVQGVAKSGTQLSDFTFTFNWGIYMHCSWIKQNTPLSLIHVTTKGNVQCIRHPQFSCIICEGSLPRIMRCVDL